MIPMGGNPEQFRLFHPLAACMSEPTEKDTTLAPENLVLAAMSGSRT